MTRIPGQVWMGRWTRSSSPQRGGAAGPSGRAEGVRAALAKLLAWVGELVFKPLNRLIATYLISGRSISALLDEVRRVVVRTLGFLVGRPRAEWLQARRGLARSPASFAFSLACGGGRAVSAAAGGARGLRDLAQCAG